MKVDEVSFLDSNILVYAVDERSHLNAEAKDFIEKIDSGEARVCISPQVVGELYATITNPRKAATPLSPDKAAEVIKGFWDTDDIWKIYPKEKTLELTLDLVKRYQIKALDFYDAQIVATMLDNEVKTILTVNEEDFKKFEEIEVVNPLE